MVRKGKSHYPLVKAALRCFPELSIQLLVRHDRLYHSNQTVKNQGAATHAAAVNCVGLWPSHPVMARLGEAQLCPAQSDHNLPLLTRLNHCLLRQEGCPLYDIIRCPCSVSASHLWLWQNEVCVFPDGQVSKSGHKLKTKGLLDGAQPRKPLLPRWAEAFNTPLSYKNRDLFNLELQLGLYTDGDQSQMYSISK